MTENNDHSIKDKETKPIENFVFSSREKFTLLFVCLSIIGLGLIGSQIIASMKIKPTKTEHKAQVQVVEGMHVNKADEQIMIPAMGIVLPAVEVSVVPEVSGNIIEVTPNFIPGGRYQEGEVILRIDPKDFEYAVIKKQAAFEKAKAALQLEQGNQDIAKHEWKILGGSSKANNTDKNLALRKPQLMEKIADMNAAKADLSLAENDLARTEIRAPFNAIIQSTSVNIGKQVSPQTTIMQLVGTDAYWIQASIPVNALKQIDLNNRLRYGDVIARVTTNTGRLASCRVLKLLSDLGDEGKMARMIIEVRDVFPNQANIVNEGTPLVAQLLLGDYVDVKIEGIKVANTFTIPRPALRDNDRVYVMNKDNKLDIIKPIVLWRGSEDVYVRGLPENAYVVTSDLLAPVQGMNLRKLSQKSAVSTRSSRSESGDNK